VEVRLSAKTSVGAEEAATAGYFPMGESGTTMNLRLMSGGRRLDAIGNFKFSENFVLGERLTQNVKVSTRI